MTALLKERRIPVSKADLIDAQAFAEWILENPRRIWYVKDYCMINTDIDYVFRYWQTKTEEE